MGHLVYFATVVIFLPGLVNSDPVQDNQCKKDLLIVLDMSYSIGEKNFDENVRRFLRQLVNEKSLNVALEGTHVALMIFSNVKNTKVLLDFSNGYDKKFLIDKINELSWHELKGDHTRTELALEIANKQILPQDSPMNHRKMVEDVIVLITDGRPQGKHDSVKVAIIKAQELKDKHVAIIGLGVGDNVDMGILESISSPEKALKASFQGIHSVIEDLVTNSCQRLKPGFEAVCTCPSITPTHVFVDPGQSTKEVFWQIPKPEQCKLSIRLTNTIPDVRPGDSFPIGKQTVQYVYSIEDEREVRCNVSFEVKDVKQCRGQVFSEATQKCCCGTIHERKPGFQCCGVDYHSKSTHKCCPGYTTRRVGESCYGPACECPSIRLGTTYTKPNNVDAQVTWIIPRPNCGGRLLTTSSPVNPGDTFKPGVYTVTYTYRIREQSDVRCQVHFEVKGCSCPPAISRKLDVTPGDSMMKVAWNIPKPNCPEAMRMVSAPARKPGQSFSIGQHSVKYVYNINSEFNMTCEVAFEVKGALCRNQGFDATKEVCCCGTIHDKRRGFQCCDQEYYRPVTHKCCPNSVVRIRGVACPRQ